MTTSQDIATQVLAISDAELFQRKLALDDRELRLLDQDFLGVALAAPSAVSIADRDSLPLLVAFRGTGLRAWEVPRDRNALLAAVDLDTRDVFFGQVFRDRKLEEHPPPGAPPATPRPAGVSATSVGAFVRRVDARAILDLPWRPARYRIALINYDVVSNLVDVTLEGPSAPSVGVAREVRPRPPGPGGDPGARPNIPTYLPYDGATAPSAPLELQLAPDATRGARLLAWGGFSLTAEAAHLPEQLAAIPEIDGAPRSVAAVVPLTIALVGLNAPAPARADLALPVYGAWLAQPGADLSGHFMLDVSAAVRGGATAGEHQVYAFFEGRIFGPIRATIA